MNFLLSEHQQMLQDSLRTLLGDRCSVRHVHDIFNGDGSMDMGLWSQLVAFGAPGILVPEAYGGLGLQMMDLALVAESLGEFAAPVPFIGHALATIALLAGGSEEQKSKWLPRLASGELLATVAIAEGSSRWLPEQWTLERSDRLHGTKLLVPNAKEAGLILVGTAGGQLALVETGEGVQTIRLDSVDRTRPVDTVQFDGAVADYLPDSAAAASRLVDAACVLLAADAYGGASRALNMSVEYAKIREQFGAPIGSFQAIKHQLANMALEVEPARGLYWYAAYAYDELPEKAAHAAAQAKAHATDAYLQATRDTVEAHGGIGFTWEHDTHIYMKRAMFDCTWLGQPSRHRERAARLAGW